MKKYIAILVCAVLLTGLTSIDASTIPPCIFLWDVLLFSWLNPSRKECDA